MQLYNLLSFVLLTAVTANPVLENTENTQNARSLPKAVAVQDYTTPPRYGDGYKKPYLPELPGIHDKLEGIKEGIKNKFDKLKKLIDLKKKFLEKLTFKDYFDKPGYCKEEELPKPYRVIKFKGIDSTTFTQADLEFNENRVNFITNDKDEVIDVMLG